MLEDAEDLARMLRVENGVFYLCGPTWPVPDVYEALVNALVKYHDLDAVEAGEFLEGLKEEERYVLEVCVALQSLSIMGIDMCSHRFIDFEHLCSIGYHSVDIIIDFVECVHGRSVFSVRTYH